MIYSNIEMLIEELKRTIRQSGIMQKDLAEKLGMLPQAFTRFFNKKNFSFDDCSKILEVIGYRLNVEFITSQPRELPRGTNEKFDEQTIVFLNLYNQLSDLQKAEVKGIIKGMLK